MEEMAGQIRSAPTQGLKNYGGGSMAFPKITQTTTGMIYFGTLLVSILSFFTTFSGMLILVSWPLALLGSLGLQIALLGLAWNLMRVRSGRLTYVIVFLVAASFSIFFSYANFNFNLKSNTRGHKVRTEYAEAARPMIRQYGTTAREAIFKGNYQIERVNQLVDLEQTKGWATVVDEGSQDQFVQSVIDGARRTVDSWQKNQKSDYKQGAGAGIIVNYLNTWKEQLNANLATINGYVKFTDSSALALSGTLPVQEQYELANQVAQRLPIGEITRITAQAPKGLPEPPSITAYIETPMNSQEALMLVIGDLQDMDKLTFFSLMFAIAVDLIVIVMAFAGSRSVDEVDHLFIRVQKDAFKRARKVSLDDSYELSKSLDKNLERLQIASRYGLALDKAVREFEHQKKIIRLRRGSEEAPASAVPTLYGPNGLPSSTDKLSRVDRVKERIMSLTDI
jgi:hypothetical protein